MAIGIVAMLFLVALPGGASAADSPDVYRNLPSGDLAPGSTITVELDVTVGSATYYAVDEIVPADWTVTSASNSGDYTSETGHVKWVVTSGAVDTTYTYTVEIPDDASGTYAFGEGSEFMFEDMDVSEAIDGDTQVNVEEETSGGSSSGGSSSGGSSSGGGGGAGSPEPASNIEIKELSQEFVTNGNHAKFNFTQNVTCITYVEFDPKRTFSKVTTIVEMLKGKSAIVPDLPAGEVYRNVNIWVGNEGMATPENIENAVVGFRVEKEWIEAGNDEASITLYRYSDEAWNELTTRKLGEDDNYVYFEAETPGFSPFVIAAGGAENLQEESKSSATVGDSEEDKLGLGDDKSPDVETAGSESAGSWAKSKTLVSIGLLSILILLGYVILKKRG